jgi:hypothetical protein
MLIMGYLTLSVYHHAHLVWQMLIIYARIAIQIARLAKPFQLPALHAIPVLPIYFQQNV